MNKSSFAQLVIVDAFGQYKVENLTEDQYIIGRVGGANNISINSNVVSSQHGIINNVNGFYVYNDLASTNGTMVNQNMLKGYGDVPSQQVVLKDGDVLTIGDATNKVYIFFSYNYSSIMAWNSVPLAAGDITIGRGDNNVIRIPSITVSRNHAVVKTSNAGVVVTDLNSSNGSILNGNAFRGTVPFNDGDVLTLDLTRIVHLGNAILYGVPCAAPTTNVETYSKYIDSKSIKVEDKESYEFARQGGVKVEINNISRLVDCKAGTGINGGNKRYILKDISLTIEPSEMVAILGGSGAGKTTFMNCINGFEPATEGTVVVNGVDLYKNYASIKSTIGYVPQQDIVHDDLTLESMLTYTAKLRLPGDVNKNELGQRVAEVLDMVELTQHKDTYIKKLSGGQRKRASIAVELISDPSLFFLDEPTSGLDPEAENNLMHQLQGLSYKKGKTVIVITHTLQNIRLFDKVIFLAPGGKLCFYGTPKQAEEFFSVDNLVDAYEIISKDIDGTVERYKKFVEKG